MWRIEKITSINKQSMWINKFPVSNERKKRLGKGRQEQGEKRIRQCTAEETKNIKKQKRATG